MKLAMIGQNENQTEKRRKTWSSEGSFQPTWLKLSRPLCASYNGAGLLVLTNEQFVDARVKNKKLVIKLRDKW